MALVVLEKLCKQHGVLAARDADRDAVAGGNHAVVAQGAGEWAQQGTGKAGCKRALNFDLVQVRDPLSYGLLIC